MKKASEPTSGDPEELHNIILGLQQKIREKEATFKQHIASKDTRITQLEQNYQYLLEQFRLAQQRQFGKSSEAEPNQLGLFNEAEETQEEPDTPESEQETISYQRNKPKRQPLPKDLPRETVVHDIDDADKVCDCCGNDLHLMGEDKSEKLEFIPAQVKVIEHIRLKYSCRDCEQNNTGVGIKTAPLPLSPIPKSIATPSLLSQVITSKYQYALPLYRQESLFKQYGIALNRKTLSAWMIRSSQSLMPVYERLKTIQLQQGVINADETPVKVIHEDKTHCYMWVYCTGADSPAKDPPSKEKPPPNIVLYEYQNSRAGVCPKDYLHGFNGYLQVDGYAAYEQTAATLVGCFAHARRKFTDAKKAQPKGKSGKADMALAMIQKLYRIETEIKGKTAKEKRQARQETAKPLLDKYKDWLDKSALHIPPKSVLGKAIAYNLRQWPKLIRYIEDGNLNIDNNRAERAIKPFVIGRKNWLFSNTENGANASAVLYSLVETAKANGLIPFDYLKYLFEELPKEPEDIDYLLPWNRVPD
jgi:transposase